MKKKKTKGMRPDGRILRTLVVGRDPSGKPIRKYFYGSTIAAAESARDEYKRRLSLGVSDSTMTLNEWIEIYKSHYRNRINPAYITNNNAPFNRLSQSLGSMRLSDVREIHLQTALDKTANMSMSTIRTYYQTIKMLFRKARSNKLIEDDPSLDLVLPRGTSGTHRALERWEQNLILQNWHLHRAGLWAMLMLLCGLRRGEMIALNWSSIDMANRVLTVRETAVIESNQSHIEQRAKTISGIRTIPICNLLLDALNTVPESKRSGLVCTDVNNNQLSASAFSRGWDSFNTCMQRIANNEPIDQRGRRPSLESRFADNDQYVVFRVRAHDLRHTFATMLYDAGIDVKTAQYWLGHADIRMTLDLYTHLSDERRKLSTTQITGFLDARSALTTPDRMPDYT